MANKQNRRRQYLSIEANLIEGRPMKHLRRDFYNNNDISFSDILCVFMIIELSIASCEYGYYIKISDELIEDLADDSNLTIRQVEIAIEQLTNKGFYDMTMYAESGILTSRRAQEAFQSAMIAMKRTARVCEFSLLTIPSEELEIPSEGIPNIPEDKEISSEESVICSEENGRKVNYSNSNSNSNVSVKEDLRLEDIKIYYYVHNHKYYNKLAIDYWQKRISTGWKNGSGVQIIDKNADMQRYELNCPDNEPLFDKECLPALKAILEVLRDAGSPDLILEINKMRLISNMDGMNSNTLEIKATRKCVKVLESDIESMKRHLNPLGVYNVKYIQ